MINEASLKGSISEAIKVLKLLNLYKGIGPKSIGNHSYEFRKTSRKNRHTDIYNVGIDNKDYEILLTDDSFFQFGLDGETLRYAFIQNPNIFIKKEDFLSQLYTPDELLSLSEEEYRDFINSINEEEYEQYLNEQDLNLEAHIIRYDLDHKGHKPLIHSCSHIHIGLNKNLRIPCDKVLTPLNFAFFAIKHTYYEDWKGAIPGDALQTQLLNSKNGCIKLPTNKWLIEEKYELYLS